MLPDSIDPTIWYALEDELDKRFILSPHQLVRRNLVLHLTVKSKKRAIEPQLGHAIESVLVLRALQAEPETTLRRWRRHEAV